MFVPTNSDEAIKLVLLVVSPANAIKTGSGVNSEVPGKKNENTNSEILSQ